MTTTPTSMPPPPPPPPSVPAPDLGVNRENPWPGLATFTESQREFFFGREEETAELFRLVKRETLTVLFGQSGLGKSSLIQAGLFPDLRKSDFVPAYIRLDHAATAPPLAEQVKAAIVQRISAGEMEATPPRPDETLWEYFHRKSVDFWTPKNRVATPVLVFDQFEEIFTLGRTTPFSRERGQAFLTALADLIENRPPAEVKARFDQNEDETELFDFDRPSCKIVLSLREDFLPDLEGLRTLIRSIMNNRMRVKRMNGLQALEVVAKPGGHLIEPGVAERIVAFVAGVPTLSLDASTSKDQLLDLEVEPSLLSLFLRELNTKRQKQGQPHISAGLLEGNRKEILTQFYERSIGDLPSEVRIFVEDGLLTVSGFRDNFAVEDALQQPGMTREVIDRLVSRRLLRLEDRLGVQRVELTHDVLTEPIRTSRDSRKHREDLAKAQAREQQIRTKLGEARRKTIVYVVAAVLVIGLLSLIWLFKSQRERTQALEAEQRKTTEALAQADRARQDALAALSQSKRTLAEDFLLRIQKQLDESPPNAAAAMQLLVKATENEFFKNADIVATVIPPRPFVTEQVLQLKSPVLQIEYSPDGKFFACVTRDRRARLYEYEGSSWKPAALALPEGVESVAFHPTQPVIALRLEKTVKRFNYETKTEGAELMLEGAPKPAGGETNPTASGGAGGTGTADGRPMSGGDTELTVSSGKSAGEGSKTSQDVAASTVAADPMRAALPIVYSSNAKWLAIAARDGRLFILPADATTVGKPIELTKQAVTSMAFMLDGTVLVAASPSRVVAIKHLGQQKNTDLGWQVGSTPMENEGKRLPIVSSASNEEILIARESAFGPYRFDNEKFSDDWAIERAFVSSPISSIAYAPGGHWMSAGLQSGSITIYHESRPTQILNHEGSISALAFRPDGRAIASGSSDGSVKLWRIDYNQPLSPLTLCGDVHAVSSDGQYFAICRADQEIEVFKTGTTMPIRAIPPAASPFVCLAVLPDQTVLAVTQSTDDVQLLSYPPGSEKSEQLLIFREPSKSFSCAISSDGSTLAARHSDGTLRIYAVGHDVTQQRASIKLPDATEDAPIPVCLSGKADKLAVYTPQNRSISIYDTTTGERKSTQMLRSYEVRAMAFANNGNALVLAAGYSGTVLADAQGRPLLEHLGGTSEVTQVGASTDGNLITFTSAHERLGLLRKSPIPTSAALGRESGIELVDMEPVFSSSTEHEQLFDGNAPLALAPSADLVAFWKIYSEADRQRRALEAGTTPPSTTPDGVVLATSEPAGILEKYSSIYEPFRQYVKDHPPQDVPEYDLLAEQMRLWEPLDEHPTPEQVALKLRLVSQTTDQVVRLAVLGAIKPFITDTTTRRRVISELALASAREAKRLYEATPVDETALRNEAEKAYDTLEEAVSLGYNDWETVAEAFGTLKWDTTYDLGSRYKPEWLTPQLLDSRASTLIDRDTIEDYQQAQKLLELAVKRDPAFGMAQIRLGLTYHLMAEQETDETKKKGMYRDAIKYYSAGNQLPNLEPSTLAWGYTNIGLAYYSLGADTKQLAFDSLQKAVETDPNYVFPYARLGNLYRDDAIAARAAKDEAKAVELYHKAIANYSQVIKLAETRKDIFLERAKCYLALQQHTEAMADYSSIIALAPDDPESYFTRAEALQDAAQYDNPDAIIADLSMAIGLAKNSALTQGRVSTFWVRRGTAYQAKGDFQNALTDFQRARSLAPDLSWPVTAYGALQRLRGYPLESRKLLDDAVRISPNEAWILLYRADTLAMLNEPKLALKDADAAVKADPQSAFVRYRMRYRLDKRLPWRQDLEECLKQESNRGRALLNLALLAIKDGKKDEAKQYWTQLKEIPPNFNWELAQHAIALAALGEFDGALSSAEGTGPDAANVFRNNLLAVIYFMHAEPLFYPDLTKEQRDRSVAIALSHLGIALYSDQFESADLEFDQDVLRSTRDPAINILIAALKLPDDQAERHFQFARYHAQTAARLDPYNDLLSRNTPAVERALDELTLAIQLGLDPARAWAEADFATLKTDSEFVDIVGEEPKPEVPSTRPTTQPTPTQAKPTTQTTKPSKTPER